MFKRSTKTSRNRASLLKTSRPSLKKSIVWEFFTKTHVSGKVKSVECKCCNASYKYFGNTTNLHDHLKRRHPVQLAQVQDGQKPSVSVNLSVLQTDEATPKITVQQPVTTSISTVIESCCPPPAKRPKHVRLCASSQTSESESESQSIDKHLAYMIAVDYQPLSIVENEGFKTFTKKLKPSYTLPSRTSLSEEIIPNMYNSMGLSVKNMLENINYISITTDLWSSESNKSYVTITGHFVYDFKIHSLVLSTEEVKGGPSSLNIAEAISKILAKWQVTDKIVTVVTNNTSIMKKAVLGLLGKHHQPCIAHTLNLSVQDAIKNNFDLSNLLTKCRSLVTYLKQSNWATYELTEIQGQMGLHQLKLKQDDPTQWNSIVVMMERLSELKLPLSAALSSIVDAPNNLDASEWAAIEDCVLILKLLLIMVDDLSGEAYPTISRLTPLVRGLQIKLKDKNPTTDVGKRLKSSLLDIISKCLGLLETNKIVANATFLDPRFKKAAFGDVENANNAECWVTKELEMLIRENSIPEVEVTPQTKNENSIIQDGNELWSYFDQKISSLTSIITPETSAVFIIKQYIEMPYLDRKKEPMEFWNQHINSFPELYLLACKYLCVPATSIPSERIYNKAALLMNDRRNRLAPEKLDELLFLNRNMKLA